MSEFHVEDIFPVSFRSNPFVVGRAVGDFAVDQQVELQKKDGTTYRGVLEALDFHQTAPGKLSLVFSADVSSRIEPGDVVYSVPTGKGFRSQ
ncbi:hypothetical protein AB0J47_22755 [Nocardia sp. NPDC049737]|uniref:hypothetical protein n=1 Tax=Nocardia sp. NPDC049737 TaxID=3154358 RepID=UPI003440E617